MPTTSRPAALAVVAAWLVALLLVVSGCGGDPEEPRPSASPTPSPSAPVVPTLPPEAQHDGRAGAVAFVKHYIELLNYAQATGDVDGLREASSPRCRSCSTTTRRLAELYKGGGSLDGGELRFIDDLTSHNAAEETWLVTARVEYAPQVVHNIDGSTLNLEGGTRAHDFVVRFQDSRWTVIRWSRVS